MSTADLWAIIGALIGAASLIVTVIGSVAKSLHGIRETLTSIETSLAVVKTQNNEHERFSESIESHDKRLSVVEAGLASVTTQVAGVDRRISHVEEFGCAQRGEHEK